MDENLEKVRLEGGHGALVRDIRDSALKPEERSRGSLKELQRLRIEALQVAAQARYQVAKALRTCESYSSSAVQFLDWALSVRTLAPIGCSESHVATHYKPYDELRLLAAKYRCLATEKARWANARMGEAMSHELKARKIAQDIRRRAASKQ